MPTLSQLAQKAIARFSQKKRADGTTYWSQDTDQGHWVYALTHAAHGDMLPDDWRYSAIVEVLDVLGSSDYEDRNTANEDADELCNGLVDVYVSNLVTWLASNVHRLEYVDRARENYSPGDTYEALAKGQFEEYREVFASVVDSLESERRRPT